MSAQAPQRRLLFVFFAAFVLVAWGAVGLYQGLHRGFSGGLYDPSYRVPGVIPGGAAERAGFRAGDRIISVDGIPVETLGMESRWPRSLAAQIGQSRRFLVERNGETVPINYVYPAPSTQAVHNRIGSALVGTGFLLLGLWVFATVPTPPARVLGRIGMAAGVGASLGLGPGLGAWSGIVGHAALAADVLVFILLLRFFEIFPQPKPLSESRASTWLIYIPWLGLLGFLIAELIVHPVLYYTTGSVAYPLMLVYSILIFAAVVHTVAKSSLADLSSSGMTLILGGLLIAILGIAAVFIPLQRLPWWGHSLTLLAVPLTMALAVRKQAQIGKPGEMVPHAEERKLA